MFDCDVGSVLLYVPEGGGRFPKAPHTERVHLKYCNVLSVKGSTHIEAVHGELGQARIIKYWLTIICNVPSV